MRTIQLLSALVAFAVASASPLVNAQELCEPDQYKIFHVNGVLTNLDGAIDSLIALQRAGPTTSATGKPITYALNHNPTNGMSDFIEAAALVINGGQLPGWTEAWNEFLNRTPRYFALFQSFYIGLIGRLSVETAVIERHRQRYIAESLGRTGSLVVSHSQGNLYTNASFGGLSEDEKKAVRAVGVAVPSDNVIGYAGLTAPYISSKDDLVIKFVPNILSPLHEAGTDGDLSGHGFQEIYLTNGTTRAEILSTIDEELPAIQVACGERVVFLAVVTNGVFPAWQGLPATIELRGLVQSTPVQFSTVGSNCPERGSPLFSTEAATADVFYAALNVTGLPQYTPGPFINRRNCSSFVARKFVANPINPMDVRPIYWVNGTGRGVRFVGSTTSDWEYQIRYFSGNPFDPLAPASCVAGVVPNSNFFGEHFQATCAVRFVGGVI